MCDILLITLIVDHKIVFVFFRESVSPHVEGCPVAQVEEYKEKRENDEKNLHQYSRTIIWHQYQKARPIFTVINNWF